MCLLNELKKFDKFLTTERSYRKGFSENADKVLFHSLCGPLQTCLKSINSIQSKVYKAVLFSQNLSMTLPVSHGIIL